MESNVQGTTTTRGIWKLLMSAPLLALIMSIPVHAQYFQLYNVDGSKFPMMSAQFVAQDAAGNDYKDLKKGEFDITENGVSVYSSATFGCKDTAVPPAANVVMILDRSGSMGTIVDTATKATRMDWVISGATSFLNTFKFVPPSEVAVISFGTIPTFESPFQKSAPPLINVIKKLKPQGGTEYNPPMLDTSFGAIKLLSLEPPGVRRIVIFLTDGQPDHTPARDSIIKLCNANAIQFYAITIGTEMNDDLRRIAEATGGKAFSAKTEDDLVAIYRLIALQTEIKQLCSVQWMAPYSCNQSGRARTVQVTFKRPSTAVTSELQYLAPVNSVAAVNLSQSTLYFGDPAPLASTTQKVTLKPVNSALRIDTLICNPDNDFKVIDVGGGKKYPVTVNAGDSLVITVQFTQQASKGYRQSTLITQGSPCPPIISMFGGLSSVRVLSPSGDINNSCDSILIKWAGVDPAQGVNIFVAEDGDAASPHWVLIKQNATGLSYKWKPNVTGKKLRVRITASPPPTYLWASAIGGPLLDTTRSIALDASELYVNVAGTFSDTARVTGSNKTAASQGSKDAFIARYASNGTLQWIESAGGNGDEGNCGVATDSKGGIYVAGYFTSKAFQFGQTFINMQPRDAVNMFVAKYNPDGSVQWVRTGGGTNTNAGYAYCDSIGVSGDSVYVYGHYKTCLGIVGYTPGTYISTTSTALQKFTAVFSPTGNPISLTAAYAPNKKYTTTTVGDSRGNVYDCGSFKGTQNNGSAAVNLSSKGDFDCFVREFGGQPGSSDSSASVFTVSAPVLSFKATNLTCPPISVGLSSDTTFTVQLCNSGDIPLLIAPNAISLTGANPGDFKITSNYDNQVFYPGECHDIEVHFQPTVEGTRTASLTFASTCGSPAVVELQGNALPPCKFESVQPYIGAQSINLTKVVPPVTCLIRNNSASDYSGWIELIGLNADEFTVTFPAVTAPNTLDQTNKRVDFKLKANKECLAANISFTPRGSGQRTALLRFHIPFECGSEQDVALVGFGLAPKVELDSAPFHLQRVKTSKPLQLTLSNKDSLDASISGLDFATLPETNFALSNVPAQPFGLAKNTTTQVTVTFTPQAEGPVSNFVNATVNGNLSPIQGLVSGEGFIPKVEALDLNYAASPVGVRPPTQTLRIHNTHLRAPLHVKSISAPTNSAFAIVGAVPSNVYLQPDSSIYLPIDLTPVAGLNVGYVDIVTDAKEGPLDDPDTTTRVKLQGVGLEVQIDPQPATFGDVLSCDSIETRTIKITNNSTDPIAVDVTADGDVAAFEIYPAPGSMNLTPGSSKTYTIRFKGTPGSHSMQMHFDLPTGKVDRTFDANGVTATMKIISTNKTYEAGQRQPWVVETTLPTLTNVIVKDLWLKASFDSTVVLFDQQAFKTAGTGGWTWSFVPGPANASSCIVMGTHTTGINGGTVTANIPLQVLNPTVDNIPVAITWANPTEYPCILADVTDAKIEVKRGCYSNGSQLSSTGQSFGLAVNPNPLSGAQLNVAYGIAYDIPYSVELFNTLGERVMTIAQGQNSGSYATSSSISGLADGVYYVRLVAGAVVETRVLSIGR